jgi:hypothetical protein
MTDIPEFQRKHYEYKILTKETFPSLEYYEKYKASKTQNGNSYYYKFRFSQLELERHAKNLLDEQVNEYKKEGWKPIGCFMSLPIDTIKYVTSFTNQGCNVDTFTLYCFTQVLILEEDFDVYEARMKREEDERIKKAILRARVAEFEEKL